MRVGLLTAWRSRLRVGTKSDDLPEVSRLSQVMRRLVNQPLAGRLSGDCLVLGGMAMGRVKPASFQSSSGSVVFVHWRGSDAGLAVRRAHFGWESAVSAIGFERGMGAPEG